MTKYTYLLVNFFTIIVPLVLTFHPKLKFYKTWWAFFSAVFLTSMFFLLWDGYYTKTGVWGVNKAYVIGVYFNALPMEEVLFFFSLPYAFLCIYHSADLFFKPDANSKVENVLSNVLIVLSLLIGAFNTEKAYTGFVFLLLALLLIIAKYICQVKWLTKFYLLAAVLLLPFLVLNGILRGTGLDNPVVWHDPDGILGIRLLSMPLEDLFYRMDLILMNMLIYRYLLNKSVL